MLTYTSTSDRPPRPSRLRFGLLSAEEIRRMAVVRVTETTLYYRGLPSSGGLLDPLMGSVDRRHLCASCRRDALSCQGHCGYIELSFPVYHVVFIETVLKILRTQCFACARICASAEDLEALTKTNGRQRLVALHSMLRARKCCPHCGMPRPSFSRTPLGIRIEWPPDTPWSGDEEREYCTAPFTAREALSMLRNLSDADCQSLGFDPRESHPRNMILQVLVVPPPLTRPAIYASEGSRSRGQNDLTVKLLECLKRSHEVEASLGGVAWTDVVLHAEHLERIGRLQLEVFTLFTSNVRGLKTTGSGSRVTHMQKTLTERLKGKEGRVRGNLMGKRVDFSARCVITPDPYFACDRVGVPHSIAKVLTIPETVNVQNIADLTDRVRRGGNLRGAQTIIHNDGNVTYIEHCQHRDQLTLRLGDVVERQIDDDDVVIFNRQPSLHKHGMQAHRVRLMPGRTFRLSLIVAAPYNADFDGDEMNMHVPQSVAARAECSMLLAVSQNVIGPQSNKPVMGIVQDSLLGIHLLTQADSLFDHAHTCRMIACTIHAQRSLPPPCVVVRSRGHMHRFWSGKQIFSRLLPAEMYFGPQTPALDDVLATQGIDTPVIVRQGNILTGVLRKSHVGTAPGGIVDVLCREYGGVCCCRFFDDAQRLTHAFLLQRDHHVGIHDVLLQTKGHTRVAERLQKASHLCEEIQREVEDDSVPRDVVHVAERSVLRILSKTLSQTGSIVNEYMSDRNAIRRMVTAGSKGTFINLSQICAALGQQSLEGSRIKAEKGTRTLPFFAPHDTSLASRGMVFNSYALGLSPTELFFHGMGGREGLVDTAVKTSQTGYIQRRLNKSFEDHVTHADGTIRNALNEIISFQWGSDGMHPACLERVALPCLAESREAIRQRMTEDEASVFLACREAVMRTKCHVLVTEVDLRVLLPFHTKRLRERITRSRATDASHAVDAQAATRVALELARNVPCAVAVAVIDILCASSVTGMDAREHDMLVQHVRTKIGMARCPTGESVGSIAAQSTGEPTTQMTLNTFHFAGVSSKNVTLGIPLLKELLDVCKNPKTPCTVVRFRHPYSSDPRFAEEMARTLPLTRLSDIVLTSHVIDDRDPCTASEESMAHVTESLIDLESPHSEQLPRSHFIIHLTLHRAKMRTRMLTPPMVRGILRERLLFGAHVSSSETNAVEWVLIIRFRRLRDMIFFGGCREDHESILCHRAMTKLLHTTIVCGHPDVLSADSTLETTVDIDPCTRAPKTQQEHIVYAYGNFLMNCAAARCIDWERCTSNGVWQTYQDLGIEACAHVLFDQLKTVISFDGQYVDDRHLMLIVDSMCFTGHVVPQNRHGINRTYTSPFMRASFEETSDVLCESACFAETENARGVSTSIMTGKLAEFGTGSVDTLFASECLAATRKTPPKERPCRPKVMRSTCRSFDPTHTDTGVRDVEYVFNSVRSAVASTSLEDRKQRVKFRPVSPTSSGSAKT